MSNEIKQTYYRLELDDYSAAAFTSFGKYYYGTLDDLRSFMKELSIDEEFRGRCADLISAFRAFEDRLRDVTHHVACREVPFLVPVRLLHTEKSVLKNYDWEHINTWECSYHMRCEKVESKHLWFACGDEYCRATKAVFIKLQYAGPLGLWDDIGDMFWGFPGVLTGDSSGFWNRLAEPEKYFKNSAEAQQDWETFPHSPDPDYTEFCNDIFGDG